MAKEKRKARVNITLDEDLYKRMQRLNKLSSNVSINWSQVIEQALTPAVELFEQAFDEIKKGANADMDKIKFLFQGHILKNIGFMCDEYYDKKVEIEVIKKFLDEHASELEEYAAVHGLTAYAPVTKKTIGKKLKMKKKV